MSIIEQIGYRRVGIVLHIAAGVFLVLAIWLSWSSVERWLGIAALQNAQEKALAGRDKEALAYGRDAVHYLPTHAGAAILAIDWQDPNADSAIDRLLLRIPSNEKLAPTAMLAIYQRMHHKDNPISLQESDDQLLTMADKIAAGQTASWPKLTSPPHAVVQSYAAQLYFKSVWEKGDRGAIQEAAGRVRLLLPKHPDYRYIAFIADALTPSANDDMLIKNARPLSNDIGSKVLAGIIRKIVELAPERSDTLLPLIPANIRKPSENANLLGDALPLQRQVDAALRRDADPQMVLAVIERCLSLNNYEAARKLVDVLKEPQRSESAKQVATASGDLHTLLKLTLDPGYTPTIYSLQKVPGSIRFHILSPATMIPNMPLKAMIGNKEIPSEKITRIGSLVQIDTRNERGTIVVACGETIIYSGVVP